jgi:death-on-curing family protein
LILSVGYRVNSTKATQFRQWATKTLRQHILQGYTINKKRLAHNYEAFLKAVDDVKKLLPEGDKLKAGDTLELVKMFASTWFSLNAYDTAELPTKGITRKHVAITADQLAEAITELKQDLISKKQASDLFAAERSKKSIESIVGNIFQTFAGKDLYPTIEEKAAHLLYFMIKNHPFVDGNKRSGAFSFVWFLRQTRILNTTRLSPEALTSLALLVAESKPTDKERMIGLILMMTGRV